MAKRQATPPPPDWRRDNPQYEQRIKDMESKHGVMIRMQTVLHPSGGNMYIAIVANEIPERYAPGATVDIALRKLNDKLQGS